MSGDDLCASNAAQRAGNAGHVAPHQVLCDVCGKACGLLVEDDYCHAELIMCPCCMDAAREKGNHGETGDEGSAAQGATVS